MKRINKYAETAPFKTKDKSEIRELVHPKHSGNQNQSVAEARVVEGGETDAHYHQKSEEIYLTTAGVGKLYIRKRDSTEITIELEPGTNVVLHAGEIHWLKNTGKGDLVILCCCSPAYSHGDTILVD